MKFYHLRQRCAMSRLSHELECARWHFFGYNPIGAKILNAADWLHKRFPKSAVVHKLWLYCLPF